MEGRREIQEDRIVMEVKKYLSVLGGRGERRALNAYVRRIQRLNE